MKTDKKSQKHVEKSQNVGDKSQKHVEKSQSSVQISTDIMYNPGEAIFHCVKKPGFEKYAKKRKNTVARETRAVARDVSRSHCDVMTQTTSRGPHPRGVALLEGSGGHFEELGSDFEHLLQEARDTRARYNSEVASNAHSNGNVPSNAHSNENAPSNVHSNENALSNGWESVSDQEDEITEIKRRLKTKV